MNRSRNRLFSIFVLLLGMVMAASAVAEPVAVRASRGDDFGRVVFQWQRPVAFDVQHDGTRLTVRFRRPIEASYQRVLGALSPYVRAVRAGADGHSVDFELTGAFDVFGYDSGRAVIVEIAQLPQSAPPPAVSNAKTGTSAPTPKQSAQQTPAGNLPKVGVRSGTHPDYSRIVFDWTRKVDYAFQHDGGIVSIRFQAPADIQIARLKRNPPPYVGDIRTRAGGNDTQVTFAVAATSSVRHFLSGNKVVVDVRPPSGSADIAALPPAPAADAETPAPAETPAESQAQAEPERAEQAAPAPGGNAGITPPPITSAAATDQPAAQPAPATAPEKAKVETEQAAVPAAGQTESQAQPSAAEGSAPPSAATAETANAAEPDPSTDSRVSAPSVTGRFGQPLALKPVEAPPPPPEGEGQEGEAENAEAQEGEEGEAEETDPEKTGISLKFDWKEPVAAAVFRRVGYVWVVFDQATTVDVPSLLQAGAGVIRGIDQAATPAATVLRIRVGRRVNPRLSRDGLSWIVEFKEQPLRAAAPIEIKAQPNSPVGARIFLPVPEPGKPIAVTDPAVGDNLVIVPVIPLGHGTPQTYKYSQVHLLQSAQGIVIKPFIDDLRVRPLRQGVELTSGATLAISSVSADVAASAKLSALKPLTKIFELDKWELKNLSKYTVRKQDLQREVAKSRGQLRESKRFNLARFYFANRFSAEALGVLARMKAENPDVENDPEFRLMRGGANYFMFRLADAAADFTDDSLSGNDEANFWRAAVVAAAGDLLAAAPELRRTGVVTRKYPKGLKIPMGILVADAAVELGDIQTARTFIDAVKALDPSNTEVAQIEFVEGRLMDLGGDTDGAISKWESVMESAHRPSRAKATVARMELLLKLERMEAKEAIEELERLRFAWRGDDFEFELLRRLGGLYLDEGIYRNGLNALRQAATYFRENEQAVAVTQQMADVFNALYLEDGADSMPPVTAIAVYEEFKELTPAGAKGDEMIRKLADRLAGVDLLEQAAEILEGQIRFRLKGPLKATVGARLSVVYQLAKQFDQALAALDATNEPGISDALAIQRRHLRARALMGLDRAEESLELLKKDKLPAADQLRAEIFWRGGDWSNASQELRKIVRASGAEKDQPLSDEQAEKVLSYAISLVLSGNERGLGRIRLDYGRAMEASRLKDAFRLVSAPTALGLIDPASVQPRVKLAENFKTFLTDYKAQLKEKGLSGLTAAVDAEPAPDEQS